MRPILSNCILLVCCIVAIPLEAQHKHQHWYHWTRNNKVTQESSEVITYFTGNRSPSSGSVMTEDDLDLVLYCDDGNDWQGMLLNGMVLSERNPVRVEWRFANEENSQSASWEVFSSDLQASAILIPDKRVEEFISKAKTNRALYLQVSNNQDTGLRTYEVSLMGFTSAYGHASSRCD